MFTRISIVCWCSIAALATGCAGGAATVGSGVTRAEQFYGDLGITGHENNIHVLRGSQVRRLSIIGDRNQIKFDAGCTLGKVEIWGEENTITVPAYLVIRRSIIGHGNTIVRTRDLPGDDGAPDQAGYVPVYIPEQTQDSPPPAGEVGEMRPSE